MVGVQDFDSQCPFCNFSHAMYELQTRTGEEWLFCSRCGSTISVEISNLPKKKDKDGFLVYPKDWKAKFEKKELVFSHNTELRLKGKGGGVTGGIKHKNLCDFKKHVTELLNKGEELDKAQYTFKRKGQWFVKDLLCDKTFPFNDEYF